MNNNISQSQLCVWSSVALGTLFFPIYKREASRKMAESFSMQKHIAIKCKISIFQLRLPKK
jgi:hypothetical protein